MLLCGCAGQSAARVFTRAERAWLRHACALLQGSCGFLSLQLLGVNARAAAKRVRKLCINGVNFANVPCTQNNAKTKINVKQFGGLLSVSQAQLVAGLLFMLREDDDLLMLVQSSADVIAFASTRYECDSKIFPVDFESVYVLISEYPNFCLIICKSICPIIYSHHLRTCRERFLTLMFFCCSTCH